MKPGIKFLKLILILLVTICSLLTACGKGSQKSDSQQESAQSEQQSEKVPSDLSELENNIEMIVKTLDGPAVMVKEETEQGKQDASSGEEKQGDKSQQDGQQGQGQEQEQNQDQNKDQNKDQNQEQQQDKAKSKTQQPQQPQNPIEKVVPIINKMHYQWNNLMPIVINKGAKKDLLDNFGNALNNLSNTVIGKNKTNTLMAASQLYSYIPDLYSLFKTNASPEIKTIRHYSRNIILNSLVDNWTQADSDISNLKSIWSMYKNTLGKEQQELVSKLEFSIYELEKVVKERNKTLTNIKGRVAIFNIETLEKAIGGESDKGSQSGGEQSESK